MPACTANRKDKLPRISKKAHLQLQQLKGLEVFVVDGVLSPAEAKNLVAYAEGKGFEHQSSRGPAHGEVGQPWCDQCALTSNPCACAAELLTIFPITESPSESKIPCTGCAGQWEVGC